MRKLRIKRPDDWHVHLRDGEALVHTVAATANHFSRALIMPNLKPALTSVDDLIAYRQRIMASLPLDLDRAFTPYMTFYLNHSVSPEDLQLATTQPYIVGAKLYPAGVTTNSEQGVQSVRELYPLLALMQEFDLVLQVHGEVLQGDVFERETLFIEDYLNPLIANFPKLRIVLEHISTQAAVEFVSKAPKTVAATITPHHLLFNRNHLLAGGLKPHYYCLPILKHARDQLAVQQAAVSGNPKFFAGTDSAPHAKAHKESACGCAGIFSAPYAVALYAQIFAQLGRLEKLDNFLSSFGAHFYQLDESHDFLELEERSQIIPTTVPFGRDVVVPICAGETLQWSVNESA